MSSYTELLEIVEHAMAKKPAEIIIENGTIANVLTQELIEANIAIAKGKIIYVGQASEDFKGAKTQVIDAKGKYIVPGFIESHIHIESSMLTLTEFAKAIVRHGTTTCVIDPHEIANVLGVKGINILVKESKNLPIRFLIEVPSCVPAVTGLETPGAVISSKKIKKLIKRKEFFALAEMMNYPGVFLGDKEVLAKISATLTNNKIVEGHAPLLSGKELQAYITAGVSSDHECSTADEALEKLRLGMKIQVRQGSFAKDLINIISELKDKDIDRRNIVVASDDRNAIDLLHEGHINHSLKLLVDTGIDPLEALQMATINTAQHLKLDHVIGSIAPGKSADIVILDNLYQFSVDSVISQGNILIFKNDYFYSFKPFRYPDFALKTTKKLVIPEISDLKIKANGNKTVICHVIRVKEHSLITEKEEAKLKIKDGYVLPDVENDILPIAVINRHTKKKSIGKSFVTGLGIKDAAIASTVAHDCHQMIVTGTDYNLMLQAIEKLKASGGGQIIVTNNKTTLLSLPFAGLMSTKTLEEVVKDLKQLRNHEEELKPNISELFMGLAFIALPVIPHLKLTDKGLVDVDAFKLIEPIKEI
ncbi:MAG: adenine deaminase [Candidatus Heimdallarchaeaceae archaeon]